MVNAMNIKIYIALGPKMGFSIAKLLNLHAIPLQPKASIRPDINQKLTFSAVRLQVQGRSAVELGPPGADFGFVLQARSRNAKILKAQIFG
jgi:hypothetical protein